MRRVAPNIDFFLHRPVLASPPICSYIELMNATLSQLMDMHEMLDLRLAQSQKYQQVENSYRGRKA